MFDPGEFDVIFPRQEKGPTELNYNFQAGGALKKRAKTPLENFLHAIQTF